MATDAQTPAERAARAILALGLTDAQEAAFVAYMTRLAMGVPTYDALVAQHRDLGAAHAMAHTIADRAMERVAH